MLKTELVDLNKSVTKLANMLLKLFVISLCLLCCSDASMRFWGNEMCRALGKYRWIEGQSVVQRPKFGQEQNTFTFTFPRVS